MPDKKRGSSMLVGYYFSFVSFGGVEVFFFKGISMFSFSIEVGRSIFIEDKLRWCMCTGFFGCFVFVFFLHSSDSLEIMLTSKSFLLLDMFWNWKDIFSCMYSLQHYWNVVLSIWHWSAEETWGHFSQVPKILHVFVEQADIPWLGLLLWGFYI